MAPTVVEGSPDSDRIAVPVVGIVADVEPLTRIEKLVG
jgi:hypothetical protein